jgi:hypothetical protein
LFVFFSFFLLGAGGGVVTNYNNWVLCGHEKPFKLSLNQKHPACGATSASAQNLLLLLLLLLLLHLGLEQAWKKRARILSLPIKNRAAEEDEGSAETNQSHVRF